MRLSIPVLLMFALGCTNSAPQKPGDGTADVDSIADARTTDAEVTPDGWSQGADTRVATDAAANADPGDDATVPDTLAYREPAAIRGGACTDLNAATSACGADSAAAVYCSLDDASRVVMAVCTSSSRGSQCDAMDDCGPGWSACTATQYVERGGRDVQPSFSVTNRAWLAACVQDAGGSNLRNEPCAPCTDFDPAYDPAVMWWCDDASVVYEGGMDGDRLGVVTSPECFRVGQNSPNNGAWWALDFASSGPPFVVCCEDGF